MTQHLVRPDVAAFVAHVRSYLSDLSPEEVEELAGGLEADLDERLADSPPGAPPADLGDPQSYAAELRSAAGLPPRGAGGGRRGDGPGILTRGAQRAERRFRTMSGPLVDGVRRQPWWPQTRESVVALRPVWWVARAWVFVRLVDPGAGVLPSGPGGLLLLLVSVGVSVALGRGLLDEPLGTERHGWLRRTFVALNLFALLLLPFALGGVGGVRYVYADEGGAGSVPGIAVDGSPVSNVFAYDASGNPIPVVQLYDQDGRPLAVYHGDHTDEAGTARWDVGGRDAAPWVDAGGQARWNVFPIPGASYPEPTYDANGELQQAAVPSVTVPPAPVLAVPPVAGVLGVPGSGILVPGAAPTPTASPTGSPTGSPSGSPSGSATASASGSPSVAATGGPSATRTP
jgi:hypothetical protein